MKAISVLPTPKPSPTCKALSILLLLFTLTFYTLLLHHHHHRRYHQPQTQAPQSAAHFHRIFLSSASNSTVSSYLRHLTLHPHLAGTEPSLDTAGFVLSHFRSLGLDTHVARFTPLLSYPFKVSLAAHFPNGSSLPLPLSEPGIASHVVPPYHAYSPSGSACAPAVFVNYGREEDYATLANRGVEVKGCVAIARRGDGSGGLSRGDVVRIAASKGAVAVLMYTEGDGLWREGVERGTVMRGVGDPLSPGWAAVEGGEALGVDDEEVLERFPTIPSLPVSLGCAATILGSLVGGSLPPEWLKTLSFDVGGVGPGPTVLNFTYQGEKKVVSIRNVFAVIRGSEEPDRYVLLGNHRDAWAYGAVDPNSGTAALLDIARRYALMMQMGWSPRRSVVFCSWDAEEFGMIGSSEWVEQNLLNLGSKAVAYLNVDCAVQGHGFFTGATPQLDDLLIEVTKKVRDPDNVDATIYEMWTQANGGVNIQRLSGVDSDFVPFLQYAGVPSVDIYYGRDYPVYHTAYDTYEWMANWGDPLFQRHVATAGIWGLMALRLADDLILPFNYHTYANELQGYVNILGNLLDGNVSLHPLNSAIQSLASSAKEIIIEMENFGEEQMTDSMAVLRRRALNDRLMLAERGFLDADGLSPYNRWFKHLVYGPVGCKSKISVFPGIAESMARPVGMRSGEGEAAVQHEVWRVSRAIQRAADVLRGRLV